MTSSVPGGAGPWRAMAITFGMIPALAAGCAQVPAFGPVIEPDQLARLVSERRPDELRILDARKAEDYERGHLAGAVPVDVADWKKLSLSEDAGFDHQDIWYGLIGGLGIDGDDAVVIYDGGEMVNAARAWFILQHFGVAESGVVNGGYPALEALTSAGRFVEDRASAIVEGKEFRPPARAKPRVGLSGRERVRQAVADGTAQVLDVRTPAEFDGTRVGRNPRGGHMPGAINLAHSQLLDERGRLRSPSELADIFERAGLRRSQPVIMHCQTGGRASLAAIAAAEAGYGPVSNYYLSFGDWAADSTCPVVSSGEE